MGLKILHNICEGLLRVCGIPLGYVLVVEIVFMFAIPCRLKVHAMDICVINAVGCWAKIASNMMK